MVTQIFIFVSQFRKLLMMQLLLVSLWIKASKGAQRAKACVTKSGKPSSIPETHIVGEDWFP